MKKKIILAALVAVFVSDVQASDVIPNHIRHPLHAEAVKTLAPKSVVRMGTTTATATVPVPDPTRAPGGLAGSNLIMGLSWMPYLSDTATYADNSVQQADIGATVAGLDSAGRVTAPVNTAGDVTATGRIQLGRLSSGRPAIMQGVPAAVDGALAHASILLGGVGLNDFAPTKITSPLLGPSDFGGCVLSVNDSPFEQYSRCGTGYDEAIGLMQKVSRQQPRLSLGQDVQGSVAAPSGTVYTVSFGGSTVTIRPALAAADAALLEPHIRLYSNYENGLTNSQANGQADTPSLWYGYVWNWTSGTDVNGTFTTINVSTDPYSDNAGWTRNTASFTAVNTTTAPGQNSGDTIDTYISSYTHPAVFIGAVGKKFVVNSMVQLDSTVPNSPTLSAEGEELDLQILDNDWWAHDKKFSIHGKTIVLTGKDHPSDDSYLVRLAGTNLIKTGQIIDGIAYGGEPLRMNDGGFHFYSLGDLEGVAAGGSQVVQQLGSQNLNGNFATLLLYGSHDKAYSADANGWGVEASLHLGLQEKYDAGALQGQTVGCIGCTSGGQIVWNPLGYHYGIGVGAGVGGSVNYALIATSDGQALLPNGTQILGGSALSLIPSTGDTKGHPYIFAQDNYNIVFGSSAGGQATLNAAYGVFQGNITAGGKISAVGTISTQSNIVAAVQIAGASFTEHLSTPSSSSAACTAGDFTDDANYHYVCTAANHWRRVALSDF